MGTGTPVNGNGSAVRAGARVLTLLATPITGAALLALSEGPKRLVDLRRACGSPAQTTLRAHLRVLEEVEAVEKRRGNAFPGAIECELTRSGRELLSVASAVKRWLETTPDGPLSFGSLAAKAAINALVEGWSSTMLRALAAQPLSLTELDGVVTALSYPSLERRLGAMKLAGQVRPCAGSGKGTPYAPTEWLRRGIAPLAAAALWERRHLTEDTPPIGRIDTETAFLLTLPLLRLSDELSGSCRLGVEMSSGQERRLVGAMAHVEDGRVGSCNVRLESRSDAWITGSTRNWLQAVVAGDATGLELGGDQRLSRALLDALHDPFFARPLEASPDTT